MTDSKQPRREIVPVVMSGGAGARLWPLSAPEAPKQFHVFGDGLTLFQETLLRATDTPLLAFAPPIVVCNARHKDVVQAQLSAIGVTPSAIVQEPEGRSTAAVAAVASLIAEDRHPGTQVLLMPADHTMADSDAFRAAVARGAEAAGRIVTFGIAPTAPETGFGYIKRGAALSDGVFAVDRFVEKPSQAIAQGYLDEGGYYWNGGIFLFAPQVMLAELRAHAPGVLRAAASALAGASVNGTLVELPGGLFGQAPSVSIDRAVMERTTQAAVTPCDAGWADVGSWSEVWRLGPRDQHGNRLHGEAVVLESQDCLVWADGVAVGVVGLTDMVVVAAHGAVLVVPKARTQDIKELVERLRLMGGAKR